MVDEIATALALDVVQDGDDVSGGERVCSVKNPFFRAKEVGKGEGCEVVGEWGTEEGGAGGGGGDTGDDFELEGGGPVEEFEDERGHAVDADIAGGEEADRASLGG